MKKYLATLALVAACSAPALASDGGRLDAIGLAPVGNVPNHGIDYGLSYAVAQVGPIRVSPLADVSGINGQTTYHLGAAATVNVAKRFDVIAEVQGQDSLGFNRLEPTAVLGVRL
jgi:hypothetical protein